MNKVIATSLMLALSMSHTIYAQNTELDEEVNAELERVYAQQQTKNVDQPQAIKGQGSQVQVNVNAAPVAKNSTETAQGTYQGQVAPQSVQATSPQVVAPQTTVVKQPTTVIEASPLQESRAELIRKSRQDAEVGTEQKIVEKLEFSRLEDEKRRADVLFGDKFQQLNNTNTNTQQVIVPVQQHQAQQPVYVTEQVVVPAKSVRSDDDRVDEEIIRNEVRASMAEMQAEKEMKAAQTHYFSGGIGMGEYMNASNVKNNYNLNFAIGTKVNDRLLMEGSFSYGSYQIQQRDGLSFCNYYNCGGYAPRLTDMDQYTGAATLKYQLFSGIFRPVFGGTVAYTYRTFSDSQFAIANNDAQSHALDAGVVAGADIELTKDFAIGLEYKYMFLNFMNRSQNRFSRGFSQSVYGGDTPIERLNQSMISIMGRANF